jgi:NADPH:quinone reductase-like Zn-dependent oxidoreductase
MRNTRVVLSALGGPEVFKVIEDEVRDPGAGEVRIRILASGVAFADVLTRSKREDRVKGRVVADFFKGLLRPPRRPAPVCRWMLLYPAKPISHL